MHPDNTGLLNHAVPMNLVKLLYQPEKLALAGPLLPVVRDI